MERLQSGLYEVIYVFCLGVSKVTRVGFEETVPAWGFDSLWILIGWKDVERGDFSCVG